MLLFLNYSGKVIGITSTITMKKVNLNILKKIWKNLGSSEEQNQGINQLLLALVFSKVMKENSWQSKRNSCNIVTNLVKNIKMKKSINKEKPILRRTLTVSREFMINLQKTLRTSAILNLELMSFLIFLNKNGNRWMVLVLKETQITHWKLPKD